MPAVASICRPCAAVTLDGRFVITPIRTPTTDFSASSSLPVEGLNGVNCPAEKTSPSVSLTSKKMKSVDTDMSRLQRLHHRGNATGGHTVSEAGALPLPAERIHNRLRRGAAAQDDVQVLELAE